MQTSGAMRREKADTHSVSSSRMRGPSIPETPMIESISRSVLGPPLSRGLCESRADRPDIGAGGVGRLVTRMGEP